MKLRSRECAGGLWFVLAAVFTTGAHSADLLAAYKDAQQADMSWRAALSKYQASPEYKSQALSKLLPSLTFSQTRNTVAQEINNAGVISPQQRYPSETRALTLRQPIIRTQEMFGMGVASAQAMREEYAFRDEEQQLAVRLVSNYLDVAQAKVALRSARAGLALARANLERTRSRLAIGHASALEEAGAVAEYEKSIAMELQASESLELSMNQLMFQTGRQVEVDGAELLGFDPKRFALPPLGTLVSSALERSPRLLAGGMDVEIAKSSLNKSMAGHLPTVDLVAQAAHSSSDNVYFTNTQVSSRSVGVQLNVPIFGGGSTSSQVRLDVKELEQAQFRFGDLSNKTRLQTQSEYNSIKSSLLTVGANQSAFNAAKMSLESSLSGVAVGSKSELDVLRAASEREQAFLTLHKSKADTVKAWLRLKAILGEIDEDTIAGLGTVLN